MFLYTVLKNSRRVLTSLPLPEPRTSLLLPPAAVPPPPPLPLPPPPSIVAPRLEMGLPIVLLANIFLTACFFASDSSAFDELSFFLPGEASSVLPVVVDADVDDVVNGFVGLFDVDESTFLGEVGGDDLKVRGDEGAAAGASATAT